MNPLRELGAAPSAVALSTTEVFPPELSVAVVRGALSVGSPSYDAVIAEHEPLAPGGESCRACGFGHTDGRVCRGVKPLAVGYLRLHASGLPARGAELTKQIRAYAEQEGLTLSVSTPT